MGSLMAEIIDKKEALGFIKRNLHDVDILQDLVDTINSEISTDYSDGVVIED